MNNRSKLAVLTLTALVTLSTLGLTSGNKAPTDQPDSLPLIPMMRKLLTDVYTIDEGIYTQDFEMIAKGGKAIADHPAMTPSDKKIIKKTLGDAFPEFVDLDMIVHHHADSIAIAARNRKMQQVIKHYKIMQQGCISCHANFRDRISKARSQK